MKTSSKKLDNVVVWALFGFFLLSFFNLVEGDVMEEGKEALSYIKVALMRTICVLIVWKMVGIKWALLVAIVMWSSSAKALCGADIMPLARTSYDGIGYELHNTDTYNYYCKSTMDGHFVVASDDGQSYAVTHVRFRRSVNLNSEHYLAILKDKVRQINSSMRSVMPNWINIKTLSGAALSIVSYFYLGPTVCAGLVIMTLVEAATARRYNDFCRSDAYTELFDGLGMKIRTLHLAQNCDYASPSSRCSGCSSPMECQSAGFDKMYLISVYSKTFFAGCGSSPTSTMNTIMELVHKEFRDFMKLITRPEKMLQFIRDKASHIFWIVLLAVAVVNFGPVGAAAVIALYLMTGANAMCMDYDLCFQYNKKDASSAKLLVPYRTHTDNKNCDNNKICMDGNLRCIDKITCARLFGLKDRFGKRTYCVYDKPMSYVIDDGRCQGTKTCDLIWDDHHSNCDNCSLDLPGTNCHSMGLASYYSNGSWYCSKLSDCAGYDTTDVTGSVLVSTRKSGSYVIPIMAGITTYVVTHDYLITSVIIVLVWVASVDATSTLSMGSALTGTRHYTDGKSKHVTEGIFGAKIGDTYAWSDITTKDDYTFKIVSASREPDMSNIGTVLSSAKIGFSYTTHCSGTSTAPQKGDGCGWCSNRHLFDEKVKDWRWYHQERCLRWVLVTMSPCLCWSYRDMCSVARARHFDRIAISYAGTIKGQSVSGVMHLATDETTHNKFGSFELAKPSKLRPQIEFTCNNGDKWHLTNDNIAQAKLITLSSRGQLIDPGAIYNGLSTHWESDKHIEEQQWTSEYKTLHEAYPSHSLKVGHTNTTVKSPITIKAVLIGTVSDRKLCGNVTMEVDPDVVVSLDTNTMIKGDATVGEDCVWSSETQGIDDCIVSSRTITLVRGSNFVRLPISCETNGNKKGTLFGFNVTLSVESETFTDFVSRGGLTNIFSTANNRMLGIFQGIAPKATLLATAVLVTVASRMFFGTVAALISAVLSCVVLVYGHKGAYDTNPSDGITYGIMTAIFTWFMIKNMTYAISKLIGRRDDMRILHTVAWAMTNKSPHVCCVVAFCFGFEGDKFGTIVWVIYALCVSIATKRGITADVLSANGILQSTELCVVLFVSKLLIGINVGQIGWILIAICVYLRSHEVIIYGGEVYMQWHMFVAQKIFCHRDVLTTSSNFFRVGQDHVDRTTQVSDFDIDAVMDNVGLSSRLVNRTILSSVSSDENGKVVYHTGPSLKWRIGTSYYDERTLKEEINSLKACAGDDTDLRDLVGLINTRRWVDKKVVSVANKPKNWDSIRAKLGLFVPEKSLSDGGSRVVKFDRGFGFVYQKTLYTCAHVATGGIIDYTMTDHGLEAIPLRPTEVSIKSDFACFGGSYNLQKPTVGEYCVVVNPVSSCFTVLRCVSDGTDYTSSFVRVIVHLKDGKTSMIDAKHRGFFGWSGLPIISLKDGCPVGIYGSIDVSNIPGNERIISPRGIDESTKFWMDKITVAVRGESSDVVAPTGFGKSTTFPMTIIEHGRRCGEFTTVIVLEPVRTSVSTMPAYVQNMCDDKLGIGTTSVYGWIGRRDENKVEIKRWRSQKSTKDHIIYMTYGLYMSLQTHDFSGCHIICDEIHVEQPEVIASCVYSMNRDDLAHTWRVSATPPGCTVTKNTKIETIVHKKDVSSIVDIGQMNKLSLTVSSFPEGTKHIVIVSTRNEADKVCEALRAALSGHFYVACVHGGMSREEVHDVCLTYANYDSAVVVGTNAIETGVTFSGATDIWDTCEEMGEVEADDGISVDLRNRYISLRKSTQRAGRVGRNASSGRHHVSSNAYSNLKYEHPKPNHVFDKVAAILYARGVEKINTCWQIDNKEYQDRVNRMMKTINSDQADKIIEACSISDIPPLILASYVRYEAASRCFIIPSVVYGAAFKTPEAIASAKSIFGNLTLTDDKPKTPYHYGFSDNVTHEKHSDIVPADIITTLVIIFGAQVVKAMLSGTGYREVAINWYVNDSMIDIMSGSSHVLFWGYTTRELDEYDTVDPKLPLTAPVLKQLDAEESVMEGGGITPMSCIARRIFRGLSNYEVTTLGQIVSSSAGLAWIPGTSDGLNDSRSSEGKLMMESIGSRRYEHHSMMGSSFFSATSAVGVEAHYQNLINFLTINCGRWDHEIVGSTIGLLWEPLVQSVGQRTAGFLLAAVTATVYLNGYATIRFGIGITVSYLTQRIIARILSEDSVDDKGRKIRSTTKSHPAVAVLSGAVGLGMAKAFVGGGGDLKNIVNTFPGSMSPKPMGYSNGVVVVKEFFLLFTGKAGSLSDGMTAFSNIAISFANMSTTGIIAAAGVAFALGALQGMVFGSGRATHVLGAALKHQNPKEFAEDMTTVYAATIETALVVAINILSVEALTVSCVVMMVDCVMGIMSSGHAPSPASLWDSVTRTSGGGPYLAAMYIMLKYGGSAEGITTFSGMRRQMNVDGAENVWDRVKQGAASIAKKLGEIVEWIIEIIRDWYSGTSFDYGTSLQISKEQVAACLHDAYGPCTMSEEVFGIYLDIANSVSTSARTSVMLFLKDTNWMTKESFSGKMNTCTTLMSSSIDAFDEMKAYNRGVNLSSLTKTSGGVSYSSNKETVTALWFIDEGLLEVVVVSGKTDIAIITLKHGGLLSAWILVTTKRVEESLMGLVKNYIRKRFTSDECIPANSYHLPTSLARIVDDVEKATTGGSRFYIEFPVFMNCKPPKIVKKCEPTTCWLRNTGSNASTFKPPARTLEDATDKIDAIIGSTMRRRLLNKLATEVDTFNFTQAYKDCGLVTGIKNMSVAYDNYQMHGDSSVCPGQTQRLYATGVGYHGEEVLFFGRTCFTFSMIAHQDINMKAQDMIISNVHADNVMIVTSGVAPFDSVYTPVLGQPCHEDNRECARLQNIFGFVKPISHDEVIGESKTCVHGHARTDGPRSLMIHAIAIMASLGFDANSCTLEKSFAQWMNERDLACVVVGDYPVKIEDGHVVPNATQCDNRLVDSDIDSIWAHWIDSVWAARQLGTDGCITLTTHGDENFMSEASAEVIFKNGNKTLSLSVCTDAETDWIKNFTTVHFGSHYQAASSTSGTPHVIITKKKEVNSEYGRFDVMARYKEDAFQHPSRSEVKGHTNPFCLAASVLSSTSISNPFGRWMKTQSVVMHITSAHAIPLVRNLRNSNVEMCGSIQSRMEGGLRVATVRKPHWGITDTAEGFEYLRLRRPGRFIVVLGINEFAKVRWPDGYNWMVWTVGRSSAKIIVLCNHPNWNSDGRIHDNLIGLPTKDSGKTPDKCSCGISYTEEQRREIKVKTFLGFGEKNWVDTPSIGPFEGGKLVNSSSRWKNICAKNWVDVVPLSPLDDFSNQISIGSFTKSGRADSDVITSSSIGGRLGARVVMAHPENVAAVQTSRNKDRILSSIRERFDRPPTSYNNETYNELVETARFFRASCDSELLGVSTRDEISSRINKRGAVGEFERMTNIGDVVSDDDLWSCAFAEYEHMRDGGVSDHHYATVMNKVEVKVGKRCVAGSLVNTDQEYMTEKPRLISYTSAISRVACEIGMGSYWQDHMSGSKKFPHSTTGTPITEIGDLLRRKWDSMADPVALTGDASKFDHSLNPQTMAIEASYVASFFQEEHRDFILAEYSHTTWCPAFSNVGLAYIISGHRLSGHKHTSHNSFVMACMTHRALAKTLDKPIGEELVDVDFVVDGDDVVIIMERHLLDIGFVGRLTNHMLESGITIRCGNEPGYTVHDDFTTIDYLSNRYMPVLIRGPDGTNITKYLPVKGYPELLGKFINSIKRQTRETTVGSSTDKDTSPACVEASKALSYLLLYPHIPIMRALSLGCLSLLDSRTTHEALGWHTKMLLGTQFGGKGAKTVINALKSVYGEGIRDLDDIGMVSEDYDRCELAKHIDNVRRADGAGYLMKSVDRNTLNNVVKHQSKRESYMRPNTIANRTVLACYALARTDTGIARIPGAEYLGLWSKTSGYPEENFDDIDNLDIENMARGYLATATVAVKTKVRDVWTMIMRGQKRGKPIEVPVHDDLHPTRLGPVRYRGNLYDTIEDAYEDCGKLKVNPIVRHLYNIKPNIKIMEEIVECAKEQIPQFDKTIKNAGKNVTITGTTRRMDRAWSKAYVREQHALPFFEGAVVASLYAVSIPSIYRMITVMALLLARSFSLTGVYEAAAIAGIAWSGKRFYENLNNGKEFDAINNIVDMAITLMPQHFVVGVWMISTCLAAFLNRKFNELVGVLSGGKRRICSLFSLLTTTH